MNHVDPLLMELMRRIPPPGEAWPMGPRLRWLRAMAALLELVYSRDASIDSPQIEVAALAVRESREASPGPASARACGPGIDSEAPPGTIAAPSGHSWLDCVEHIPGGHFLNIFPDSNNP